MWSSSSPQNVTSLLILVVTLHCIGLKCSSVHYLEFSTCYPFSEGWEARALLGFFESKRRAKENITRQIRNNRRPLPPPRRRR